MGEKQAPKRQWPDVSKCVVQRIVGGHWCVTHGRWFEECTKPKEPAR